METKKSKLGLGIFIGVLIGLVIGLSSFIIYDKVIDNDKDNSTIKDDNKKDNNQDNVEMDEILTLNIDDKVGNTLYENITLPICSIYNNYYYRSNNTLVNDMSSAVKMYLTAKNIGGNRDESHINEANFEESFHKLFGENTNYQFTETDDIAVIKKENNGDILYYYADTCVPNLYKNVIKIEKNNTKNEYYIYENVAFLKLLENGDESGEYVDIYKDYQYNQLLKSNIHATYSNGTLVSINIPNDLLATYKYTFKQNTGAYKNDYYFYSVEKVEE